MYKVLVHLIRFHIPRNKEFVNHIQAWPRHIRTERFFNLLQRNQIKLLGRNQILHKNIRLDSPFISILSPKERSLDITIESWPASPTPRITNGLCSRLIYSNGNSFFSTLYRSMPISLLINTLFSNIAQQDWLNCRSV